MKRLPVILLAATLALVAMVTGCSGAHRYDSRLTAADALMHDNPDSAMAIIGAVNPRSLNSQADRAFHALLLTQARYRCYIVATSDSDINRALDYYRAHPREREKLTRAHLYKGAVMEELGHPDSAMFYYKSAEAIAAPDDYFNQGYVKLRIAEMYQDRLTQDSTAIIRLQEARHDFELLNDTNYLIMTLGKLGAITGTRCPDSTEAYLSRAISLSQQFNPTLQYTYKSKLSTLYLFLHDDEKANRLAMDVFNNGKEYCYENQYYYNAALSFVKLGKIDSAKVILNHLPKTTNPVDSMSHYNIMAEIAKAEGNMDLYGKYVALSKDITTRIIISKKEHPLSYDELRFSNDQLEKSFKAKSRLNVSLIVLCASAFLFLAVLVAAFLRLRRNLKTFEKDKILLRQELESARKQYQDSQQNPDTMTVSELVGYRMSALDELYQSIRCKIDDDVNKGKKVVPLSGLLSTLNERNRLLKLQLSDSFWEKMRTSVDGEFNNIISFVEKKYPNLTQRDLRILCLLCSNLSPQIIKLCLNFANVRTVSNYRNKLVKQKMGLDMSLDEFIDSYMKGEIS